MTPDRELPEREQRVVELLTQARACTRAPAGLRARMPPPRPPRLPARRRLGRLGADLGMVAASLVAIVVVGVILVTGGSSRNAKRTGVLSLTRIAALAPEGPAPAPDRAHPRRLLAAAVAGLHFPNWEAQGGWRASAVRSDRIAGRQVLTVYYRRSGQRLVYSIAAPPALPWAAHGRRYVSIGSSAGRGGERYRAAPGHGAGGGRSAESASHGRATIVWWYRGHTCALSAVGLSDRALWQLAQTTLS